MAGAPFKQALEQQAPAGQPQKQSGRKERETSSTGLIEIHSFLVMWHNMLEREMKLSLVTNQKNVDNYKSICRSSIGE
jgi:hypothetical protein